jgi:hypothetical protein
MKFVTEIWKRLEKGHRLPFVAKKGKGNIGTPDKA